MIRIHSIFQSISGEVGTVIQQGTWCTFIRLQGCNLKCSYCDVPDAQDRFIGFNKTIKEVADAVTTENVVITGGEPLYQKAIYSLIRCLLGRGKIIQIETNGSISLEKLYNVTKRIGIRRVGVIMDYKLNNSNMMHHMIPKQYKYLACFPSVMKFVISNKKDLNEALSLLEYLNTINIGGFKIAFGMTYSATENLPVEYALILKQIRSSGLQEFIFNVQVHKVLQFV